MTEVILSCAFAAWFLYLIPRMPLFSKTTVNPLVFQVFFGLKLVAAIGLYFIYTTYYSDRNYADIFRYYDDSAIISNSFTEHPRDYWRMLTGYRAGDADLAKYYDRMRNWYNTDLIFNDSRTMIRICAFLRMVSLGTYFPIAVILSFLAMCGLTGLYRTFDRVLPGRELPLLIGVFLLPSTLLWTSGVIKEAVLVFAAGLFLYQFVLFSQENKLSITRTGYLFLLTACLFLIKSYFIFLMMPGIVAWLLFRKLRFQAVYTVMLHVAYYGMVLFILPQHLTGRELPQLIAEKQNQFIAVGLAENAKSMVEIPVLNNSYFSIFQNAPSALLRTLARPFVSEAHNPLMLLAGLENLLLNIFILACLFGISRTLVSRWKGLHWSAFFLVISLAILIGLITPILGALVRYKVPILPFLIFILVALPSSKWIERKPNWLLK